MWNPYPHRGRQTIHNKHNKDVNDIEGQRLWEKVEHLRGIGNEWQEGKGWEASGSIRVTGVGHIEKVDI